MRPADADGAGWKTRQRRRQDDIDFLARLRNAAQVGDWVSIEREADTLAAMERPPKWRVQAVLRAAGKCIAFRIAEFVADAGMDLELKE